MKKTFKEIHGKTRLGKFLQDKSPKLLKIALNVVGDLIPGTSEFTTKISKIIDSSEELYDDDKIELLELIKLDFESTKDARNMYQNTGHDIADKLAVNIIRNNLIIIGALILIDIVAVIILKDYGQVLAIISGFIGMAIGNLFSERNQVISFFFGSSAGSKMKDLKLNK